VAEEEVLGEALVAEVDAGSVGVGVGVASAIFLYVIKESASP